MGSYHVITIDDYEIPNLQAFNPDMSSVRTAPQAQPGYPMAYDTFGWSASPVNNVATPTVKFVLRAATRASMQTELDTLLSVLDKGVKRLKWDIPGETVQRVCFVTPQEISYASEIQSDKTEFLLPVEISFETTEPYWLDPTNEQDYDVYDWSDSSRFAVTPPESTTVTGATPQTLQIDYDNGIDFALPRVVVECTTHDSAQRFKIERLVSGSPVETIELATTEVAGLNEVFEIDCRRATVLKDGVNVYRKLTFDNAQDWLKMLPGTNDYRCSVVNSASAVIVFDFYWFGVYR